MGQNQSIVYLHASPRKMHDMLSRSHCTTMLNTRISRTGMKPGTLSAKLMLEHLAHCMNSVQSYIKSDVSVVLLQLERHSAKAASAAWLSLRCRTTNKLSKTELSLHAKSQLGSKLDRLTFGCSICRSWLDRVMQKLLHRKHVQTYSSPLELKPDVLPWPVHAHNCPPALASE